MFNCELENVADYKGLTDFCSTFKLYRGKSDTGEDDPSVVGEFKVKKKKKKTFCVVFPEQIFLNGFIKRVLKCIL